MKFRIIFIALAAMCSFYNYSALVLLEEQPDLSGFQVGQFEAAVWPTLCLTDESASQAVSEEAVPLVFSQPGSSLSKEEETVLGYWFEAAHTGKLPILQRLIDVVDVNAQDSNGNTALICAICGNHENIIQILLQLPGLNINLENYSGHTALMWAAFRSSENIVRFMLQLAEIDIFAQDNEGKTALDWAKDGNKSHNIQAIKDRLTWMAFDAIRVNNIETLKSIVAQIGIDVVVDAAGNTLLDMAFAVNNREMILYLLRNAKNPQELLACFPFERISPTSDIFKLCMDIAYGKTAAPVSLRKRSLDDDMIPASGIFCPMGIQKESLWVRALKFAQDAISAELLQTGKAPVAQNSNVVETVCKPIPCAFCSKKNCSHRCSRCHKVYYCSGECQKRDWQNHKIDCKELS